VDTRLYDLKEGIKEAKTAADTASCLARNSMDKRLDEANHLRNDMRNLESTFVTQKTYEAAHQALLDKVDMLRIDAAELKGKASQSSVIVGYLFSAISALLAIIALIKELMFK
jgi:hypothetical protein